MAFKVGEWNETPTSFGSCFHSPSTRNLYWWSPSGMLMMVTKSACDFTIGSTFHCENVPLMNTCLPPPSHLNTVGSVVDWGSSSWGPPAPPPAPPTPAGISDGVVPSDMVLDRFLGSRVNSGSGTDFE
uniref:Uncharacterized protein n=1 Tax=Anopheles maculatus TaxID=74869 RepID=A0A182T2A4_9DIPT